MEDNLQKAFKLHASIYKALSNPKRLEVINLLRDQELTVSEISQMLGIRQANLSQHLTVLRRLGIVKTRRNGNHIYYKLTSPAIIKAQDLIRQLLLRQLADKEVAQMDLKNFFEICIDPVCKMHINAFTASDRKTYRKKTYYFCGRGCKQKFSKNPTKYLAKG